ncbi:MAG: AbrB/MazE/SpoVT family DNA-binding domain-containing protein [Vicinamibacterales bacterium]
MRLTIKGQITIPQDIREKLGLHAGTEVVFDVVDDSVRIRKAVSQERRREHLRAWVGRIRGAARDSGVQLTTDQIMALTRGED